MARDQHPKQERAQATRAAIVLAAATVFARRGYARTTLDEVAVAAGVTKGALYFHFSSKHDLADAVIEEETRITSERAQATLAEGRPGLETLVRLTLGFTIEIVDDVVVAAGVRLTTEELGDELHVHLPYEMWAEVYLGLLRRGVDEGQLRSDLDPEKVARFLVAAFTGVQSVSNVLTGRADLVPRVREMWETLLPAICAPEQLDGCRHLPELITR
ncbi:ScbR family autoregulator-binding transcription factor [Frondihabitans peucedani]|uniref:ScbR family autoregulator-binding transcription factor n=1 Tax=Frondihabitans peucedani TaxID=598626 RepID=A0ABP8E205_9MICO